MDRALAVRAAALYAPTLLAAAFGVSRLRARRQIGAVLVGAFYALGSLLVLQLLNLHFGWWQFHVSSALLRYMPADLYLGWTVLWGVLPTLAFPQTRLWQVILIFLGIDLAAMPLCFPAVQLSSDWLVGELAAVCLVLIPAQLFSRWTLHDLHLSARVTLQVVTAGMVFLLLLPEVIFAATGHGSWAPLHTGRLWIRNLALQCIALLAVGGVSAVQEFAQRGAGTPIPYDPPKRLVSSGLYRYIANPMQTSCVLTLTAWGLLLKNPWLAASGLMALIYSSGLARWNEGDEMRERFGASWPRYRSDVKDWKLRWRPWHDPQNPMPRLYVAESCGPCSEVRRWFEARHPVALNIMAAEDHPSRDLSRITYDPMDGTLPEEGIRAFARGLEHLNFAWAYVGACLRLPIVRQFIQLLLDVSGLGPQTIRRRNPENGYCEIPSHSQNN
jgi:protein-S-isoprenylcysteine O-methyltransferase Ste14